MTTKRRPLIGDRAWRDERTIREILGPKDYRVLSGFLSGTYRLIQKIEHADAELKALGKKRGLKMSDGLSDDARAALEGLAECLEGLGARKPAGPSHAPTLSAPKCRPVMATLELVHVNRHARKRRLKT